MLTTSRPRLFFTDEGGGEPVLLITGWTISSAVFDPVAGLYLPHVRVIAYDHRGTGRSATWPAPLSVAVLAADAARVLDERGVRCAHVMGLSMGAGIALELAIRMPSRVKSLVLVGGTAGGPSTVLPPLAAGAGAVGAVVADSIRHRGLWPAAALFSEDFRTHHPDLVAGYVPSFGRHRARPWAVGWQTLAVACFGRRGSLGHVRAPTLVLNGTADVMTPPANARLLADGIPRAELHLVPGAGHAVPMEQPEATARLIVEWARRHAAEEPSLPTRRELIGERVARPFSLSGGALRNSRDGVALAARSLARHPRDGRR